MKDFELLVLRHELEVLRRHVARPKPGGSVSYHPGPQPSLALASGSRSTAAAEDHLNAVVHNEQGRYWSW